MQKRLLAIILTAVTLFSLLAPMTATAVDPGDKVHLYNIAESNAQGHRYHHGLTKEGTAIDMVDIFGHVRHSWGYVDVIRIGSETGPLAYCIQLGTPLGDGDYIAEDAEFNAVYRELLSSTATDYISLITMYGYSDSDPLPYLAGNFGSNTPMLGAERELIAVFAADNAILKPVVCYDVKVYFIFRITLGKNSLVGKVISASFDICGKDNGPYLYIAHFEDGQNVGEKCTLKFRTEKSASSSVASDTLNPSVASDISSPADISSSDPSESTTNIPVGESLAIDYFYFEFEVGEDKTLSITQYPTGYTAADITWSSEDPNVAAIDSNGKVTAKNEGVTVIVVKTSDGKYVQRCSVTVNPDKSLRPIIGELPGGA